MARPLVALRLAVILALSTSFVGPSAADPIETAALTVNYINELTALNTKLVPIAQSVTFLGGCLLAKLQGPLYTVKLGLQDAATVGTAAVVSHPPGA